MKYDLSKHDPCSDALNYYSSYKTFEDAWDNCPRGDWMFWIAQKLDVNIRTLTLVKGYCAKTVIHLMKYERDINAVKTAIKFGRYKATNYELEVSAYVASVAYTATYAANAAYVAAWVDGAADAADALAAAKKQNQLETANICRKYLTRAVMAKLKTK